MNEVKKENAVSTDPKLPPTSGANEAAPEAEKKTTAERRREKASIVRAYLIALAKGEKDIKAGVPPEVAKAIDQLAGLGAKEPGTKSVPAINAIFGADIKIGLQKTPLEIFTATGKGFSDMRKLVKKWADDTPSITVVYDEVKEIYTITAINPTGPALKAPVAAK